MEELDGLREELVEARAEAERLAEALADREARAQQMAEGMETLRRDLESARTAAAEESRRLAERYRTVLLQAAPDVLPELVQGESVDELDRSLVTARETVARVREQMQTQAAARIPAGSPARGGPDLSGLSPAEKIRLGISDRQ